MSEAEDAAARLGKSRAVENVTAAAPRDYRWLGIALAVLVIAGASSLSLLLNRNDVRSDGNPHADGRIPLPSTMTEAPQASSPSASQGIPKAGPDGAPDIGAMVARLENRVNGGSPTIDDVIMLARSYRVLNREDESLALYRRAQTMAPDDLAIKVVLASALIRSENDAYRDEGEKIIDDVLVSDPKKPEALWLKSLGLVKRHEIEAARKTLTQLSALVTDNSEAKNAVASLLKELETASAGSANSGADSTTPAPDGQSGAQSR